MPDEKQPDEKTTVHFAAVPAWAVELKLAQQETQVTLETRLDRVDANMGLISSDLDVVKGRVGNLEQARANDEARANANSIKINKISDADMASDAKLADVIIWRAAVEKKLSDIEAKTDVQTTILGGLSKVSKDPRVIGFLLAAIAFATAWFRSHT